MSYEQHEINAVLKEFACWSGLLETFYHDTGKMAEELLRLRAERDEPPTGALAQWVVSLREGDTLTGDDIQRFGRVELALRNADKHHQQARAMTAERDAAVRERDELAAWKRETESFARTFLGFGMTHEDESVWSAMGGANQNYAYYVEQCEILRARLAACERVVEAAKAWAYYDDVNGAHGLDGTAWVNAVADASDILRAAVAAETQGTPHAGGTDA